jgi:tRNA (guanine37-N1)-methyltransferase
MTLRVQGCFEVGPRSFPLIQPHASHAAFIEKKGTFGPARRSPLEQQVELALRAGEIAAIERLERASKFISVPEHSCHMFEIDVVTLFPEVFAPFVGLSIVGRAVEAGIATVRYHHLLDHLKEGERADDAPFGGGPGMVLRIEPIARVLDSIVAQAAPDERRLIAVPSPSGERFDQRAAERLARLDRLILVCGHYEGIDERLAAIYPVQEYSLGDFVLTGGEIPALAFMDATIRLLEGTIASGSLAQESFSAGMLDYPSFTRPATFRGVEVPAVLLSGDHAKIAQWRREQSRLRTAGRRRDLLDDALPPRESP